MSRENQATLEIYERLYQNYFDGTQRRAASRGEKDTAAKQRLERQFWFDAFDVLGEHADILEIGSADGEGAKALARHGFNVTASDTVDGFIKALKEAGLEPVRLNILTGQLDRRFDGVLAWNVFVHFTPEDLKVALRNVHNMLRLGGRFVFNVQTRGDENGETAEWIDYEGDYHMGEKRFFQYYSESGIGKIIDKTGFEVVKLERHKSGSGHDWLRFVITPKSMI